MSKIALPRLSAMRRCTAAHLIKTAQDFTDRKRCQSRLWRDRQLDPRLPLQIASDAEQVAGSRISGIPNSRPGPNSTNWRPEAATSTTQKLCPNLRNNPKPTSLKSGRRRVRTLATAYPASGARSALDDRSNDVGLRHIYGVASFGFHNRGARPLLHELLGRRRNHSVFGDQQVPARLRPPGGFAHRTSSAITPQEPESRP
jgi:hypothetical protein